MLSLDSGLYVTAIEVGVGLWVLSGVGLVCVEVELWVLGVVGVCRLVFGVC